ncbi:MAG: gliding motility lipoprotein GldH [Crocinitomicaceae bacterium]|nr:gliding motility lipoprotein GldH [Crocinitomicaceae bacterium]
MNFFYIIITLFSLTLFSCSDSPSNIKGHEFSNKIWKEKEKINFDVNIPDTNSRHDITFYLRTTTDYKYRNLWINMYTKGPSGKENKFPFEIITTNKDGSWIGEKTGSIVEHKKELLKNVKFSLKGKYVFSFEQASDKGDLKNVIDATLVVENSKK